MISCFSPSLAGLRPQPHPEDKTGRQLVNADNRAHEKTLSGSSELPAITLVHPEHREPFSPPSHITIPTSPKAVGHADHENLPAIGRTPSTQRHAEFPSPVRVGGARGSDPGMSGFLNGPAGDMPFGGRGDAASDGGGESGGGGGRVGGLQEKWPWGDGGEDGVERREGDGGGDYEVTEERGEER